MSIVRGPFLNPSEMQNFEPLVKHHFLHAHYSMGNYFDTDSITISKQSYLTLEGISFIGRVVRYPLALTGLRCHMMGLVEGLKGFDIIHAAETFHTFTYQSLKARNRWGSKLVVTVFETIPFANETPGFRGFFKDRVRRGADRFVAVSRRACRALVVEGVNEDKIVHIPFGVDLNRFCPRPKDTRLLTRVGLKGDEFVVLFSGRMVVEKGLLELLQAIHVLARDPEIRRRRLILLILASKTRYFGRALRLTDLLNRLGLSSHVKIIFPHSYEQIHHFYNIADALVLPSTSTRSWEEQFGFVLVEAMASGIPVVATNEGAIPEVVDSSGLLVPSRNSSALASAIRRLVTDPDICRMLSHKGRDRAVREFDKNYAAEQMNKLYSSLN